MKSTLSPKGIEMQRKILLAASKVVALKGIENASVTEIAKKARVTRSLIQYYLPKQSSLLVDLIGFIVHEAYHFFQKHDAEMKCHFSMPEALEKRIRLNFRFFDENTHFFQCFMLLFYRAAYDSECRAINTRIVMNAIGVMKQSVGQQELAERIYFGMNVAIQRCFIIDNEVEMSEAVNRFLKEVEGWLR